MAYDDGETRWRFWLRFVFPELLADLPDNAPTEDLAARVCERWDAMEKAVLLASSLIPQEKV